MPLYHIEESQPFQFKYIFATNSRLKVDLSLARDWEFSRYDELYKRVTHLGIKKFQERFNSDLFQPVHLRRLLNRLTILPFSLNELETLHKEDKDFQKAFDRLSRRLLNVPKQGFSLHEIIQTDVILFCDSKDHKKCYDLVVDDRICHIGSLGGVQRKLEKVLEKCSSQLINKISGIEIGLIPRSIESHQTISSEGICRILTLVLNNEQLMKSKYQFSFYVLPVTFDIIAFQAFPLAEKIGETKDQLERVYPGKIDEIQRLGLGPLAIKEITRLVYLHGFGYKLPMTDIVVDINT